MGGGGGGLIRLDERATTKRRCAEYSNTRWNSPRVGRSALIAAGKDMIRVDVVHKGLHGVIDAKTCAIHNENGRYEVVDDGEAPPSQPPEQEPAHAAVTRLLVRNASC